MQSVRSLQANQLAEISRLDGEIRELSGRIEEIEYGLLRNIEEMNAQMEFFARRMPAPSVIPKALLEDDEKLVSRMDGEGSDIFRSGLKELRLGSFFKARATFEEFSSNFSNPEIDDNVTFWLAFSNAQLGSTDKAIVLYSDVFQKFPKGDRADAALYYLAETFSDTSEKEDAKIALKKLIRDYPRSSFVTRARRLLSSL